MATTNVVDGGLLLLKIAGTTVAKATSHSFSINMATRDITNKDSGEYVAKLGGLISWECSADALYAIDAAYGFEDLFTALKARTAVTVLMMRTDVSGDAYYTGSGFITSLEVTGGNEGENATYSVSIEGTAEPTKADIT